MTETKPPKVFISYAWEDDLKTWVLDFATRLRSDGINAILDQWETVPGDQLPEFMEKSVRESDFVVFVCTPTYKRKSDRRKGGVGYEGHIITGEVFQKNNHRKFIPILQKGKWAVAAPSWATSKLFIDFRGDPYSDASYQQLLNTLFGKSPTAPPVWDDTLREKVVREAAEKAAREKAERESVERAAREKAEREAAKEVEREKAEREAIERAKREQAEHEVAKKIAREKAERETAEKAAREKSMRDAAEKAKREKEERQTALKAVLMKTFSNFLTTLKSAFLKVVPFIKITSIIGIVIVLFWASSMGVSELVSLVPTPKPSTTDNLTFSPTLQAITPPMVFTPSETELPTKTLTPIVTRTTIPVTSCEYLVESGDTVSQIWTKLVECSISNST